MRVKVERPKRPYGVGVPHIESCRQWRRNHPEKYRELRDYENAKKKLLRKPCSCGGKLVRDNGRVVCSSCGIHHEVS